MSELPKGWAYIRLEQIIKTDGGTLDPRSFPEETFDLFSIPSFSDSNPERTSGSNIGSTKQIVHQGDVLLSKIVPHIRRVWVVPEASGYRQIASGEWIIYNSCHIEPHFVRLALSEGSFRSKFLATVSGVGGSLMRANPKQVAQFSIPLPPLAEQKRIVAKLDALSAKSARARTELARIETLVSRYKQAVLRTSFLGKATKEWRANRPNLEAASELISRMPAPPKARGGRDATDQVIEGKGALAVNKPQRSAPSKWQWVPLSRIARQETGHTPRAC